MSRRNLWVSAGVIVLVVLIAFLFSVPHIHDAAVNGAVAAAATSTPVVALHDAYKKGLHTITGSITVPNACTPVSSVATLAGSASSTQSILVTLTFQPDEGICLQLPTSVPFELTLTAPSGLPVEASVNGVAASTTPL